MLPRQTKSNLQGIGIIFSFGCCLNKDYCCTRVKFSNEAAVAGVSPEIAEAGFSLNQYDFDKSSAAALNISSREVKRCLLVQ